MTLYLSAVISAAVWEGHVHAPSSTQSRQVQLTTVAPISYLDRWAGYSMSHHHDIMKPCCTGQGTGSCIPHDRRWLTYLRVYTFCCESQHLQFGGCGSLQEKMNITFFFLRFKMVHNFTMKFLFSGLVSNYTTNRYMVSHLSPDSGDNDKLTACVTELTERGTQCAGTTS